MSIRSSQAITTQFTTRVFSTGVLTDADSTPTGTLYVNGTANGAAVTITKISTGLYKAAFTLPSLSVGDWCCLVISATVSSVSDSAKVWEDTKDIVIDSAGLADATTVKVGPSGSATAQTAGDLYSYLTTNLGSLGANLSAIPKTGFKLASDGLAAVTAWTVAITGNVTGNLSGSVGSVSSFGTLVSDVVTAVWGAASRTLSAFGFTVDTNANATETAIKAQTDQLGFGTNGVNANLTQIAGHTVAVDTGTAGVISFLSGEYVATNGSTFSANVTQWNGENVSSQTDGIPIVSVSKYYDQDTDDYQNFPGATTIRIKKNTAFSGFSFAMFDSSGVAATGKTVTATVAIDGASFVSLTNAPTEIGSGAYMVDLAAADTNGNDLMFLFTADGCRSLFLKVITQT